MSRRLVESLRQRFGDRILRDATHHGDDAVWVRPADLPAVLEHLKQHESCEMLGDIVAVDYPQRSRRFEVNYYLRSVTQPRRVFVKVDAEEGEALPSVTRLWRSADWHEREVYDLFGIPFAGHPNLKRILCHHQFEGHALRKDYPIELGQECTEPEKLFTDHEVAAAAQRASRLADGEDIPPTDLLAVNLGPSHPATHGCLRIECLLDGETIVAAKSEIGYLHRCFEKEAEDHTWAQVMPYTDRLNYCSAMLNNVIYAGAVEKLLGVEVTPRCRAIRVIVSELSRIIDHLVCVGTNLVDMGALTIYWYTYNVRESIYQIIEKLCGSRLTTNYARIGGLSHDLYPGFEAELRAKLVDLAQGVGDTLKLVARNRIFLDRTIGVGRISREDAISHGFTGPCLRATGVAFDVRKAHPYLGYDALDFEVPTATEGDTYARIQVRLQEIIQSQRLIEQCLAHLPAGPVNVDDPRVILPPKAEVYGSIEGVMNQFKLIYEGIRVPAGEGYGFGEGANGELGFYCVADGSGHPYRIKVRPPCFPIFGAFTDMIIGGMVSDAVATLGSINIIAGELDR